MPNGINDISPNLRDWLLNRNLILSDTVTDNGLQGLAVGLGQPAQIDTPPNSVQASTDITSEGEFYRDLNLLYNPYKSINGNEEIDITTATVGNIGNLPPGTQPVEYQQNIGSENPTSPFNQSADEAREQMLKNQYFDDDELYKVNINTNITAQKSNGIYQFRTSLIERTVDFLANSVNLGSASQTIGTVVDNEESEMGRIANEQLLTHFGYNAAFGLAQETLGQINLNPLSQLQGNDLYVQNFALTVPRGQLGRGGDFFNRVTGVELPVSDFDDASSIFQKENPVTNTIRANAQVQNTGKGQVLALIDNLSQNKYKPTISDDRSEDGEIGTNGELYAFDTGEGGIKDLLSSPTTDDNAEASEFEREYGRITGEIDGGFNQDFGIGPNDGVNGRNEDGDLLTQYGWSDKASNKAGKDAFGTGTRFNTKKSLLSKTESLFNTNKMRTLVTGHGVKSQTANEIQTSVQFGFASKGSGVLSPSAAAPEVFGALEDPNAKDVFCRTWTTIDRYNNVFDLQKSRGLDSNAVSTLRKNVEGSVLDDNGFVRIAPKVGDGDNADDFGDTKIKRFMFSIENLAWGDDTSFSFLPNCEKGPGDPITGTRGRIMWFPPYGMNFTDNSSVNWDTTNFIGRGEPIYTYNNTERSGTLQWQVIIDHPTNVNDLRDTSASDEVFASIAAGCMDLDGLIGEKLSQPERDQIEVATAQEKPQTEANPAPVPQPFKVYFPNDKTNVRTDYEDGDGQGVGSYIADAGYITEAIRGENYKTRFYEDNTDFGLNGCTSGDCPNGQKITLDGKQYDGWKSNNYIIDLVEYILEKAPATRVQIFGYASQDGENTAPDANQRLSEDRAKNVAQTLRTQFELNDDPLGGDRFEFVQGEGATGAPRAVYDTPSGNYEVGAKCLSNCIDSYNKKTSRYTEISFRYDETLDERLQDIAPPIEEPSVSDISFDVRKRYFNECSYFQKLEQNDKFIYNTVREKVKYFHPAFHSITPEGFNARLNFLMQCTRQGPTLNRDNTPTNLAFGKAPVCILRIGDFYHTKIVIDNLSFSFDPLVWDLNPEGVGVQPMICNVDLSFKFIGGSSLQGPINRLQNAVSFNFFANSEIYDERADFIKKTNGINLTTGEATDNEYQIVNGVNPNNFDNPSDGYKYRDAISAGITTNPSPEIDEEARAEQNNSGTETEEEEG
jgi:hypothetical protein